MDYYISDLEGLEKNRIWKEMKKNAYDLIDGLHSDLERLDPISDAISIGRIQGRIGTIRMIFDGWIEDIKIDLSEKEKESKDGLG